ncbi:MAG: GNAT family N-acetyltransferase [Chloroflexi bacterium]|nr:GNAT family N-acetyltransferase [Chloroflexota bacterium]
MPESVQPTNIFTARLTLRPFRESDSADVFVYASDPAFRKYAPYISSNYSLADAVSYVQQRLDADWGTEPTFAVEHEGKVIGSITMRVYAGGSVEFGYGIANAYQGQGFATEATSAALDWAISIFGASSIFATTDALNHASIRVLEKLGLDPVENENNPSFEGRIAEVKYETLAASWMENRQQFE